MAEILESNSTTKGPATNPTEEQARINAMLINMGLDPDATANKRVRSGVLLISSEDGRRLRRPRSAAMLKVDGVEPSLPINNPDPMYRLDDFIAYKIGEDLAHLHLSDIKFVKKSALRFAFFKKLQEMPRLEELIFKRVHGLGLFGVPLSFLKSQYKLNKGRTGNAIAKKVAIRTAIGVATIGLSEVAGPILDFGLDIIGDVAEEALNLFDNALDMLPDLNVFDSVKGAADTAMNTLEDVTENVVAQPELKLVKDATVDVLKDVVKDKVKEEITKELKVIYISNKAKPAPNLEDIWITPVQPSDLDRAALQVMGNTKNIGTRVVLPKMKGFIKEPFSHGKWQEVVEEVSRQCGATVLPLPNLKTFIAEECLGLRVVNFTSRQLNTFEVTKCPHLVFISLFAPSLKDIKLRNLPSVKVPGLLSLLLWASDLQNFTLEGKINNSKTAHDQQWIYQFAQVPLINLDLRYQQLTDMGLALIARNKYLSNLTYLNLHPATRLTEKCLPALKILRANIKNLKELVVSSKFVSKIKSKKKLEELVQILEGITLKDERGHTLLTQ